MIIIIIFGGELFNSHLFLLTTIFPVLGIHPGTQRPVLNCGRKERKGRGGKE